MSDLRTSFIIDLAGNLQARAQQFSQGLTRLGRQGSASMQLLGRGVAAASRGLDRLGNRYTALLGGAAGVGTLKQVGDLSERMTQLGVDAGITADEVDRLRQKVFETSRMPDIRVDPGEILSAIEEIVKSTGDLPFAERNLRNLGLVIRASASSGKDVGAMATELQKLDKAASPEKILEALDIFNVQGKAGAVAMRDLAAVGPRVFAAYASKRKGADPATFIRELGAALQTIKGGTGNVEQAATSFEALMRVFTDAKKVKGLQAAGIQVFDPKALKQGREELRPVNELMAEIVAKTQGRATLLDALIGDIEAIRALQVSNLTENLRKYYSVQADGSTTIADAERNAREFNAALTSIGSAWKDVSARNLTGPIRSLADGLNSLTPETVDRWFKVGAAVVGVGGALVVAGKLAQAGSRIRDLMRGGKAGVPGGLAGGKFGDAIPVYVVNGAMSVLPEGGAAGKAGKAVRGLRAAALARLAGMGSVGATLAGSVGAAGAGAIAGTVAAGGAAGYGLGTLVNNYVIDGTALGDKIGEYLNRAAALFGSQESKLAIEINTAGGATARVTRIQPAKGQQIDIDAGRNLVGVN